MLNQAEILQGQPDAKGDESQAEQHAGQVVAVQQSGQAEGTEHQGPVVTKLTNLNDVQIAQQGQNACDDKAQTEYQPVAWVGGVVVCAVMVPHDVISCARGRRWNKPRSVTRQPKRISSTGQLL
ncbi:hypothetical protein THUN1379_12020 [Paludibacterium sp. THUN1379]|nr:hypothetical protein THUN1379_12020 [Paludibacterium sp. THUN1379]